MRILLSSLDHASSSVRASTSEILRSLSLATSHTHNAARPLPSRVERKASNAPLGDQLGCQLLKSPEVTFLVTPVFRLRTQVCAPSPYHGTPVRAHASSSKCLVSCRSMMVYASIVPSGDRTTGE